MGLTSVPGVELLGMNDVEEVGQCVLTILVLLLKCFCSWLFQVCHTLFNIFNATRST